MLLGEEIAGFEHDTAVWGVCKIGCGGGCVLLSDDAFCHVFWFLFAGYPSKVSILRIESFD